MALRGPAVGAMVVCLAIRLVSCQLLETVWPCVREGAVSGAARLFLLLLSGLEPYIVFNANTQHAQIKQCRNFVSDFDAFRHLYRPHYGAAHDFIGATAVQPTTFNKLVVLCCRTRLAQCKLYCLL